LHEDKKYYPDASEVYPEAEVCVCFFDTVSAIVSLDCLVFCCARAFSPTFSLVTQVLVQDEDTQPLEVPIIDPMKAKDFKMSK
jgi:hypothetical protein